MPADEEDDFRGDGSGQLVREGREGTLSSQEVRAFQQDMVNGGSDGLNVVPDCLCFLVRQGCRGGVRQGSRNAGGDSVFRRGFGQEGREIDRVGVGRGAAGEGLAVSGGPAGRGDVAEEAGDETGLARSGLVGDDLQNCHRVLLKARYGGILTRHPGSFCRWGGKRERKGDFPSSRLSYGRSRR